MNIVKTPNESFMDLTVSKCILPVWTSNFDRVAGTNMTLG